MKLTKNQNIIFELIKQNPDITVAKLHEKTGIHVKNISKYAAQLRKMELIKRKIVRGHAYFQTTGIEPSGLVKERKNYLNLRDRQSDMPDPLLRAAETFELRDDQWNYIRANLSLSRKEISQKLGIPRTVLLAAIERRKERERGRKD